MRASKSRAVPQQKKGWQNSKNTEGSSPQTRISEESPEKTGERTRPSDFCIRVKEALKRRAEKEALVVYTGIFLRKDIGVLEALVKHLHESRGLTFAEIARAVGRDDRTIWTTYQNATRKAAEMTNEGEEGLPVPVRIFKDRNLGTLEALASYLQRAGLEYRRISEILGRSPRTIYTVLWRIKNRKKKAARESEDKTEKRIKAIAEELCRGEKERINAWCAALSEAGLSKAEILREIEAEEERKEEEILVPARIFADRRFTILEALISYLHRKTGLGIAEISETLRRPARSIKKAIESCRTSDEGLSREEVKGPRVPVRIFREKTLSMLEALAWFLSEEGYSYSEIAEALNRPKPTIWTVLKRAEEKLRP